MTAILAREPVGNHPKHGEGCETLQAGFSRAKGECHVHTAICISGGSCKLHLGSGRIRYAGRASFGPGCIGPKSGLGVRSLSVPLDPGPTILSSSAALGLWAVRLLAALVTGHCRSSASQAGLLLPAISRRHHRRGSRRDLSMGRPVFKAPVCKATIAAHLPELSCRYRSTLSRLAKKNQKFDDRHGRQIPRS
jgi:hypothetical protein